MTTDARNTTSSDTGPVSGAHVHLDPARFDTAVRVQDDLYRHVNGRWLQEVHIDDDKASAGAFVELRDAAEQAVHQIIDDLTSGSEPAGPGSGAAKVRDLYASFMDEERVEQLGAAPLRPLLERVDAISTTDELAAHLGWCSRHGIGGLFDFGTDADPGDPQRYVMFFGQGGLGLPDEDYYRADEHRAVREAYVAHVCRSLELAGVPDAAQQAGRVMRLETDIAAHHWDRVRTRDMVQMYNLQTWAEFTAASDLPWDAFLSGAGLDADAFPEVVNAQPSFFTDVAGLVTAERLDDWRAWARWHAVHSLSSYLSGDFVTERFGFYDQTLRGIPALRPRWKRGVSLAEGALGEAIGEIYVRRHFPPEAKARMDDLVQHLIQAYEQSIRSLTWMGEATREQALDKLARFTPKIGYPDTWRDYGELEVDPTDLVGNVLRSNEFDFQRELRRVHEPVDRGEWLMYPQTVNAYYHPLRNEIVFPAAILQPPFFSMDADDALNYGGIGAVIGHEIGHGFDDQGSTCDGEGRLRNWWTDDDRAAFEKLTASLIAQYDALVPTQLAGQPDAPHVNGRLTIGENIGDLGGLGIAIKAWRLATEGRDVAEIDGNTGLQRLFLNWALIWQEAIRDEALRTRIATDPHSPDEFRCNQIVKNLDDFAEAFGVQEGDALWLAPEERVRIW